MGLKFNHKMLSAITNLITKDLKLFFQQNNDTMKTIKELGSITFQKINGNNVELDLAELKPEALKLQQPSCIDHESMIVLLLMCKFSQY